MDFTEFSGQILDLLRERNESADISIRTCSKNNGVQYVGVAIRDAESNMAPIIYLEPFYSRYLKNDSLLEIVRDIEKLYSQNKKASLDTSLFLDYENVKEQIIAVVINKTRNMELLSKVPNREYIEDIAIAYKILMDGFDDSTATVLINNELLKNWDVSEEELFNQAITNNKILCKPVKRGMSEVLVEMMTGKDDEEIKEILKGLDEHMYVISTACKVQGASAVLDNDFMRNLYEEVGAGVLVPSSLYEMLYIPAERDDDICANINPMIQEVNRSQLAGEEILGDNAYYFDGLSYEMIK